MIGLVRKNFKNTLNKRFGNFSNCSYRYDKPMLGAGFYTFFWGGCFTLLITSKITLENYYLHTRIEDLKKEINDLKKKNK